MPLIHALCPACGDCTPQQERTQRAVARRKRGNQARKLVQESRPGEAESHG